jgi:hypothetical protein
MRGSDIRSGALFTLGADNAYDAEDIVNELRSMNVRAHVARNDNGRRSAIDRRTTRHAGYAVSQRIRKRIEEGFGWIKTVAGQRKTRFKGKDRVGWAELQSDGSLVGEINFHKGDEIPFIAQPWPTSSTPC